MELSRLAHFFAPLALFLAQIAFNNQSHYNDHGALGIHANVRTGFFDILSYASG